MPLDETYNITEFRTVVPGQKLAYSVQAWKKQATPTFETVLKDAITLSDTPLPARTTPVQRNIAQTISQAFTASEPPPASGHKQSLTFEQSLAMTETPPAADTSMPETTQTSDNTPWSFDDIVDVINPLQHIPLVSMAYRSLTGDAIGAIGQIVGGALYGGPIGAVSGAVNAIVQETTGKDIAGNVLGIVTRSFNE